MTQPVSPEALAPTANAATFGAGGQSGARAMGAVGVFFALKVLVGMTLVVQSARALSLAEFGVFSQLFLFLALLSTVSAGGVQSGLIRQVAAAGNDRDRERRSIAAALLVWLSFGSTVLTIAVLAASALSVVLVGDVGAQGVVPLIAAAALGAGGGQLLCAVLTGRKRQATSMALQSLGMVVGGAICWWRLSKGDAQGAVLGYTVGPLVTFIAALPFTLRLLPRSREAFRSVGPELRLLLSFSGAFVVTATVLPATLFGLRYSYRMEFGEEALSYWLAANRVSDVTSQLLGLFMGQIYLPAAARQTTPAAMRSLAWRAAFIGLATMAVGAAVFTQFATWIVGKFLSAAFVPAIPFIIGYLVGDTFRVLSSLALHTALARSRLRLYVGIEMASALCLSIWILSLTKAGYIESAYWGYVAANFTMAAFCWIGWQLGWSLRSTSSRS